MDDRLAGNARRAPFIGGSTAMPYMLDRLSGATNDLAYIDAGDIWVDQ